MLYDLHMHSCLSPCAEDDMTPANIAGLAKLAGAELIAVTDHNAADNLPAVQRCCNAYGLRLLPGVEVNTAEEIHVLCYFKTVDTALEFGRLLYAALPEFPYDPAVWGRQLVMDENDEVLRTVDKLLTAGDPVYLQAHYEEMYAPFTQTLSGMFTADWYFEYTAPGIDKARALEGALPKLGIDASEVVSFGDGQNDKSMIEWAGTGVAMGNAVDEVKAVAQMVTANNNEDGIAVALNKLLG